MKKSFGFLLVVAVALIGWFVWHNQHAAAPSSGTNAAKAPASQGFNKRKYSIDNPASLWVVVNKHRALKPATYVPADLITPGVPLRLAKSYPEMKMRKTAGEALERLFAAAEKDGLHLQISSGYRSYDYQTNLYNHYVQVQGRAVADTQSARPGYSEHQTGLSVDVEATSRACEVQQCFGNTTEGKWLAAAAYQYGFIIRYPKDMNAITGYEYEPWHIRYVGIEAATEMHTKNIATLEQFFGLEAAPDYQ